MTTSAADSGSEGEQSKAQYQGQAREGLRAAARRAADRLAGASYPTVLAVLCSAACAPVAAVALGAGVSVVAALGVVGGVGTNFLSQVIDKRVQQLRSDRPEAALTEADIQAALEETLTDMLAAGDERTNALAADVHSLMVAIGVLPEIIGTAVKTGNDALADLIISNSRSSEDQHTEIKRQLGSLADQYWEFTATQRQVLDILTNQYGTGAPVADRWKGNPYQGLNQFEEKHAKIFFGRSALAGQLVEAVRNAGEAGRPLLVIGASGAGKSSLLRAGLAHAFAENEFRPDSDSWPRKAIRPGQDPLATLAAAVASLGGPGFEDLKRALHTDPDDFSRLVSSAVLDHSRNDEAARLLLIVDQFEELFTKGADREVQRNFVAALGALASRPDGPALVVLGMRGDFFDHCIELAALTESLKHPFPVGPMNRMEMREAILGPLAEAGGRMDTGLADDILDGLATSGDRERFAPGTLPLLSETMSRLWERRENGEVTRQAYKDIGGVTDAVANSANQVYQNLGASQDLARDLFVRLTAIAEDGTLTRRTEPLDRLQADLGEEVGDVVRAFAEERFLVVNRPAGDTEFTAPWSGPRTTVELAHECLFTQWGLLRTWIEEDRASLSRLSKLKSDAADWVERHHRHPSYLYLGERLRVANDERLSTWDLHPRFDLDKTTLEFLAASRHHVRRRTRIRNTVTAGLSGLTGFALVLVLLVVNANGDLTEQRNQILSEQLAAASRAAVLTDGPLAQLLAAAAWQTDENDASWAAMGHAADATATGLYTEGHQSPVYDVVFSPDGAWFASRGEDGSVALWDSDTWEHTTLEDYEAQSEMVVSPDATTLAAADNAGRIQLWEVESGTRTELDPPQGASYLAYDANGTRLVASSYEGRVSVWDTTTHEMTAEFEAGRSVASLHLDRTGELVLVRDADDGNLYSFDPETGDLVETDEFQTEDGGIVFGFETARTDPPSYLECPYDCTVWRWTEDGSREAVPLQGASSLADFSPDGSLVLAAYEGGGLGVWDAFSGKLIGILPYHPSTILASAMSLDGHTVIAATGEGVQRWDLDRLPSFAEFSDAQELADTGLAADGHRVVSVNAEGTTVRDAREPETIVDSYSEHPGYAMAMSSESTHVATSTVSATEIWDLDTGATVQTIEGNLTYAGAALSPDGALIAGSNTVEEFEAPEFEYGVNLWDTDSGAVSVRLDWNKDLSVTSLDFSPDGSKLATVNWRGTVQVWNPLDGSLIASTEGAEYAAMEVRFSSDGATIAGAAEVGGILIWEADAQNEPPEIIETGYEDTRAIAFSPDGKFLVAEVYGFQDQSIDAKDSAIIVWDLDREQVVASVPAFDNMATGLSVTPDGNSIVAGYAQTVQVFDIGFLDDPYTAVCEQAGRKLTDQEWDTYLSGIPASDLEICE